MKMLLFVKMEFRGIVTSTSHSGYCLYNWETVLVSIFDWKINAILSSSRDCWESNCVGVGALVVGVNCCLVCYVCQGAVSLTTKMPTPTQLDSQQSLTHSVLFSVAHCCYWLRLVKIFLQGLVFNLAVPNWLGLNRVCSVIIKVQP